MKCTCSLQCKYIKFALSIKDSGRLKPLLNGLIKVQDDFPKMKGALRLYSFPQPVARVL